MRQVTYWNGNIVDRRLHRWMMGKIGPRCVGELAYRLGLDARSKDHATIALLTEFMRQAGSPPPVKTRGDGGE